LGLGGFAERALIHENQLALVPKEMPFAQAALLGCGVVTGAGAVLNTAIVASGDTVVIFGAGGVGLNAISGARIAGASRIVVIDIQPKRLEVAKKFGATDVIDSQQQNRRCGHDLLGAAPIVFDFVGLKAVADRGLPCWA
jgi:S-(hydroxymethyl)glutathione dehydrogenase/alcohol dehydrogenase